jgi:hypothetical protein
MIVEMYLTFPLFNKMKYTLVLRIGNQFISDAPGFFPDDRNDRPDCILEIAQSFGVNRTSGIDKYHAYSYRVTGYGFFGSVPFVQKNQIVDFPIMEKPEIPGPLQENSEYIMEEFLSAPGRSIKNAESMACSSRREIVM